MLDDHYSEDCAVLTDAEYRTHTDALVWVMARGNVSGGLITERDVRRFAETADPLEAVAGLVGKGFWAAAGPGSWQMIRDIGRQRTAEQIDSDRAANAARQARSRDRKRNDVSNGVTHGVSHSVSHDVSNAVSHGALSEPTSCTEGSLFSAGSDLAEVKEGKPRNAVSHGVTQRVTTPTISQRAKPITDEYYAVQPMSKWPAINGIVIHAIKSGKYADEQIRDALLRLAAEGRSVTVETLRIEIEGLPPQKPATSQRSHPLDGAAARLYDAQPTARDAIAAQTPANPVPPPANLRDALRPQGGRT